MNYLMLLSIVKSKWGGTFDSINEQEIIIRSM